MHDFRKLEVWRRSRQLSIEIYKITKAFPKEELFGLSIQIRKASVSIAVNIAEGCGRPTQKSFCHFLSIALGSAYEVETQLSCAFDFGYVKEDDYKSILNELLQIESMIAGLRRSLE